jgi:hypothetical protein
MLKNKLINIEIVPVVVVAVVGAIFNNEDNSCSYSSARVSSEVFDVVFIDYRSLFNHRPKQIQLSMIL